MCVCENLSLEGGETETGIARSRRGRVGFCAFASLLSGGSSENFWFLHQLLRVTIVLAV